MVVHRLLGALLGLVVMVPTGAYAQDVVEPQNAAPVQPSTPAPSTVPSLPAAPPPVPAPPEETQAVAPQAPAAPQAYAAPQAPSAPVQVQYSVPQGPSMAPPGPAAQGQWVFTNQYGWIWTPYAQNYTYVDQVGEMALTYAFYPSYGWRWLPSPWVLGFGPTPYWGMYGYDHYAWHARPWFSIGIYRPAIWQRWGRPYGGYGGGGGYGGYGINHGGAAYGRPYGGYNGVYTGRPGSIYGGPRPTPVYSHPVYSQPSYAPRQQQAPAQYNAPARGGGFGGAHFGGGHGGGGGHHR